MLASISPNPVQGLSTFRFALRQSSFVEVKIYDSAGRVADTEYDGTLGAGDQRLGWFPQRSAKGGDSYQVVAHADMARGKVLVRNMWTRALARGIGRLRLPHPSSAVSLGFRSDESSLEVMGDPATVRPGDER